MTQTDILDQYTHYFLYPSSTSLMEQSNHFDVDGIVYRLTPMREHFKRSDDCYAVWTSDVFHTHSIHYFSDKDAAIAYVLTLKNENKIMYTLAIKNNEQEEYLHTLHGDDCFTDDIGIALLFDSVAKLPPLEQNEYPVEVLIDSEGGISLIGVYSI